ncbi:MAG: ABC transporter substrate-binding protein [Polyangiaceae bacterium]|nr:ABC transporter substrate-binding protein [Polyangiaceae bacterium]
MTTRRELVAWASAALALGVLGTPACRDDRVPAGRDVATLWFSYGGRNREVLERLVAKFNAKQETAFVRAVFQGDYFEGLAKLRTALAAGTGPTFSHVIGEIIPYLAATGKLEPLDGYPGAGSLGVIPELGQARSWVGGDQRPLVALPFNRSTPIAYLNGAAFEAAGLGAPRTWDELRTIARALTIRRGSVTERFGFGCPAEWWFWVALTGQAGGEVVDPDGRVTLGGEAGIEAVRFWQRLIREDGSMKRPVGRDYDAWEATKQDFLTGRTAMIWTSTAFLKYLEENARFPVIAAALPAARRRAVPTGGTHWVVLKDAPAVAKQAAWAFLRFMYEPAQVMSWATSTGYLPVTHAAVAELERGGYYTAHPNDRVAVDQLGVALPWPWCTELFRIQREIVQPHLERLLLTDADARPVLEEARRAAAREHG